MRVWLLLPLVAWLAACGGAPFEDVIPGAEAGSGEAVQEPEAGGGDAMNHPDSPAGAQDGAAGHEAGAPEAGQSEGSAPPDGGQSEAGVAPEAAPNCGPTTCPTGCCSAGVCVTNVTQHVCGASGHACDDCGPGGPPYNLVCGTLFQWQAGMVVGVLGGACCEEGVTCQQG